MIGDFERISDHSVNILESAEEIKEKDILSLEKEAIFLFPITDSRVLLSTVANTIKMKK